MIRLLALLLPAHATIPGLDAIANGLLHPLATPPHLLLLLAVALSASQSSPTADVAASPMRIFASTAGLALLVASHGWIPGVPAPALLALALFTGALVAAERPLSARGRDALFAAAAILVGLDSPPEAGGLFVTAKFLLGVWLAMIALVFYVPFYVSLGREKAWVRIGVRILGSWILAISLLVLALALR